MEFFNDHVKWIFSGIGVAVLSGIIGLFLQRKNKSGSAIVIKHSKRVAVRDNEDPDIDISNSKDVEIEGNFSGKKQQ